MFKFLRKIFLGYNPEDVLVFKSELFAKLIHANGKVRNLGLICTRVVTTAGVTYLAADFAGGSNHIGLFKYHGCGTGTNEELPANIALQTPIESRSTGSQGSVDNVYTTIATIAMTDTHQVTEHGLFSASTSGTLWDRSVFSVINVTNGDSIQFTYALTCTSGG